MDNHEHHPLLKRMHKGQLEMALWLELMLSIESKQQINTVNGDS